MKKPGRRMHGMGGLKAGSSSPLSAKRAAGPAPAGGGNGPMSITAPKGPKQFGHKAPDMKALTTDRGAFRLKG